jgi:hypothetical protein
MLKARHRSKEKYRFVAVKNMPATSGCIGNMRRSYRGKEEIKY